MPDGAAPPAPVEVLVCTTCRAPGADPAAPRAGAALAADLAASAPEGLRITPVECLSNCSRGCTIALRGAGRWTYIYGDLDPARDLPALLEGAARYRAAPDGLVPWRERPEHFRKHCIARIPPLEAPHA
jgi:predicted metal-binding protein